MIATIAAALGLRERTARLLAVLLGAGVLLALYGALWARGEHFRAEAAEAVAGRAADRATWREAYRKAFLEHFLAAQRENDRNRRIKEQADADYFDATLAARDSAAAYAAGNQCVRSARAAAGAAGSPGVPGTAAAAALAHGPARPAELGSEPGIWISRTNFDRCTITAVRLGNAHSWGVSYRATAPLPEPDNYSPDRGTGPPPGR